MFPVLLPTPRVRGAAERGRRGSTGDVFIVLGSPALGGDFPRAFRYLGDNHLFVFHPDLLTVLYKMKGTKKWGIVLWAIRLRFRSIQHCASTSSTSHQRPPCPMSWLAARAAREACSTSGRTTVRGAIAACIARGAEIESLASGGGSRWDGPGALWRQDRGAKRSTRRVEVVLLQVRFDPPTRPARPSRSCRVVESEFGRANPRARSPAWQKHAGPR